MIGLLKLINKKNKKIYLLKTVNIKQSIYNVRYKLRNSYPLNSELQADWNLYGEDSFYFDFIECEKEDLSSKLEEQKGLADTYNSKGNKNHPWSTASWNKYLSHLPEFPLPERELINDCDGDLLALKFCCLCELHKLEDSFISDNLYCRTCRDQIEEEEIHHQEVLEDISFL